MQTNLAPEYRSTPEGQEAEASSTQRCGSDSMILR